MKANLFDNSVFELGERMLKFARVHDEYYTRPIDLKRFMGLSMYMARKVIKHYFDNGYFKKIIAGGGCDDYGDPIAPWNGYELTKEGKKKLLDEFDNFKG